ncbi:protein phosphatase 1 regulatory subunit 37-like [Acanthaster planci]|uniref:Protein phosphatase 1 regulatory subunit 37-like n=1 Tax=Acanthaster planci TaxID=133434 RepID=A0A8B7YQT8_ACAPL|nr:protein phosphatase 1 regulatory subunit 37-like [Acanthaster planci]XP_022095644.1 protein phosphatase 1 regulatory subunit 37-like [Acanthaster planci]
MASQASVVHGPTKPAATVEGSGSEDGMSPNVSPSKKHKLPGRHVNFPEGDTIVSVKVDPPNPWRHAKGTSTEELQAVYQAACYTMKVKPNAKVVQQLQNIKDFTKRMECFSLKGEKVDIRVVETLEEVFKRVQFNTVDMEAASLDDEAAVALFDMLEFYESAIRLVLASNRSIGARGWQAASRLLKRVSSLECLDIRNTNWTEYSMPMLARALRADITLSALHMEGCNISGRPLFLLLMSLKQNNSVRDLYLAENRLIPSDAIHLGSMLKHNRGLKLLDLRNNHIQDAGLSHLCDGLLDQMEGQLTTLVLWNNQLTQNGMTHLAKALPMLMSLETLNLGQNNLGNDGVHILKDALMKNRSLLRLGLYACRFGDQGTVALAEYVADNWQLIRLDLRENDVRTGGLMALSYAMKVNKVLLRLDLDKDVKREQMRGYEDLQKSLQSEISVHIQRNREISRSEQQKTEQGGSDQQEETGNMQQGNRTISSNHGNEQEQLESTEIGPQSPTTRVNPRTLNVRYVADPSSLPVETEASTANNDPLNLVSFDGGSTVGSTAQTSSTSDNSAGQQPMQASQGGGLRRDYKDELDSPTGVPLANNIQLLAHPMQAAMAAASPTILSQSTLVMGYGHFDSFIPVGNCASDTVPSIPQTDLMNENPTPSQHSPNATDATPSKATQPEEKKSDLKTQGDPMGDRGHTRDPLTLIVEGNCEGESVSLVNGTVEAGNKTNAETEGLEGANCQTGALSSSPDDFEKELDQIMAKVRSTATVQTDVKIS